MEFCPKCGAILIQKIKNMGCPRCGYSKKEKSDLKTSEKMDKKEKTEIYSKNNEKILPIVVEKCKKCGHDKSYFWTVQTRAGDEAETKFFKCVKCGNTWREYR